MREGFARLWHQAGAQEKEKRIKSCPMAPEVNPFFWMFVCVQDSAACVSLSLHTSQWAKVKKLTNGLNIN